MIYFMKRVCAHVHSLCLITDSESRYEMLYLKVKESLSKDHPVIYAAEADANSVIRKMVNAGIEAENFIEKGILKIIDAQTAKQLKAQINLESMDPWYQTICKTIKQAKAKNRLLIICRTEDFEQAKLLKFEEMVDRGIASLPIELICCYPTKWLTKLDLSSIIGILNAHTLFLYGEKPQYLEWHRHRTEELLKSAIEAVLGNETSKLIFKTFKLVYKMDEQSIISNPIQFEDRLKRLLGSQQAKIISELLVRQIEKTIKTMMAVRGEDQKWM